MNAPVYTIEMSSLHDLNLETVERSITALESGHVIYSPQYAFSPNEAEQTLLSESVLAPHHKNISYDYQKQRVAGINPSTSTNSQLMSSFMHRFAEYSKQLIDTLIPRYSEALIWGRTSYRPAEIKHRKTSPRKDDTRLHVDAFPSTPVNGLRILRVFCNINPHGKPRAWNLGEPFANVLEQFLPSIPRYNALRARLLKLIKATKSLRSPYDHLMLHLHDHMKLDQRYQRHVQKHLFEFPAHSTWVVFTDQVSHAALGGQYLMEQTFYLPVSAMKNPELSPLKQWEKKVKSA